MDRVSMILSSDLELDVHDIMVVTGKDSYTRSTLPVPYSDSLII
jgi:hypothetical protein